MRSAAEGDDESESAKNANCVDSLLGGRLNCASCRDHYREQGRTAASMDAITSMDAFFATHTFPLMHQVSRATAQTLCYLVAPIRYRLCFLSKQLCGDMALARGLVAVTLLRRCASGKVPLAIESHLVSVVAQACHLDSLPSSRARRHEVVAMMEAAEACLPAAPEHGRRADVLPLATRTLVALLRQPRPQGAAATWEQAAVMHAWARPAGTLPPASLAMERYSAVCARCLLDDAPRNVVRRAARLLPGAYGDWMRHVVARSHVQHWTVTLSLFARLRENRPLLSTAVRVLGAVHGRWDVALALAAQMKADSQPAAVSLLRLCGRHADADQLLLSTHPQHTAASPSSALGATPSSRELMTQSAAMLRDSLSGMQRSQQWLMAFQTLSFALHVNGSHINHRADVLRVRPAFAEAAFRAGLSRRFDLVGQVHRIFDGLLRDCGPPLVHEDGADDFDVLLPARSWKKIVRELLSRSGSAAEASTHNRSIRSQHCFALDGIIATRIRQPRSPTQHRRALIRLRVSLLVAAGVAAAECRQRAPFTQAIVTLSDAVEGARRNGVALAVSWATPLREAVSLFSDPSDSASSWTTTTLRTLRKLEDASTEVSTQDLMRLSAALTGIDAAAEAIRLVHRRSLDQYAKHYTAANLQEKEPPRSIASAPILVAACLRQLIDGFSTVPRATICRFVRGNGAHHTSQNDAEERIRHTLGTVEAAIFGHLVAIAAVPDSPTVGVASTFGPLGLPLAILVTLLADAAVRSCFVSQEDPPRWAAFHRCFRAISAAGSLPASQHTVTRRRVRSIASLCGIVVAYEAHRGASGRLFRKRDLVKVLCWLRFLSKKMSASHRRTRNGAGVVGGRLARVIQRWLPPFVVDVVTAHVSSVTRRRTLRNALCRILTGRCRVRQLPASWEGALKIVSKVLRRSSSNGNAQRGPHQQGSGGTAVVLAALSLCPRNERRIAAKAFVRSHPGGCLPAALLNAVTVINRLDDDAAHVPTTSRLATGDDHACRAVLQLACRGKAARVEHLLTPNRRMPKPWRQSFRRLCAAAVAALPASRTDGEVVSRLFGDRSSWIENGGRDFRRAEGLPRR